MNTKQQLTPIPNTWNRALAIRPPDFRALIATWTDPVVRRKGLSIYEEMLLDPQVYASLNLLKFAALALEFNVAPREDGADSKATEIAKEVQLMLEGFPGGLHEFMYNALSALEYGWSITELVWKSNNSRRWVPFKWVALPQAIYGFELDDKTGDPKAVRTWFAPMMKEKGWPLENFFILRWNSRFGAPYGRSQLLPAYESWWVKQLLRRMRNTTLDRFGSPLLIGRVPAKYDEAKRKRLQEFIENLYAEAGVIVDTDVIIETPHSGAGQGASQGFQAAIDYEDAQISKGITGATLHANESRGAGTYAQARVHQDNFLYWVGRVSKMLEEALQKQVVDRYCRYNYGLDESQTPVIKFVSPSTDDINTMAGVFMNAVSMGLVDPQKDGDWMREKLNFPPSEKERKDEAGSGMPDFFKQLLGEYGDNEEEDSGRLTGSEPVKEEGEESLTGNYG